MELPAAPGNIADIAAGWRFSLWEQAETGNLPLGNRIVGG
jgi:hypothetical protein